MKKTIYKTSLITLLLLSHILVLGQVRLNGNGSIMATTSTAFIDYSSNTANNPTTNQGKGIVFPRTDLSLFTTVLTGSGVSGLPTNFPTNFDGMLVYNTAISGTAALGGATLKSGFYYYSNKNTDGTPKSGTSQQNTGRFIRLLTTDDLATFPNLYTANGTLAGARTVTMGANPLTFTGTGNYLINAGNVGIGTPAPTAKLHTVGTLRFQGLAFSTTNINFLSVDGSGNVALRTFNPLMNWTLTGNNNATVANFIGTTNSIPFRIATSNIERMRVTEAGNVGIGTLTPSQRLSVDGTILVQGQTSGLITRYIDGRDLTTNNPGTLHLNYNNNQRVMMGNFNNPVITNMYGSLSVGPQSQYSPGANLDVTGNILFRSLTNNNSLTKILVSDTSGYLSWRDAGTLGNGGTAWLLGGNNNITSTNNILGINDAFNTNSLRLFTKGTEKMTILSNGNIGIGTNNPSKLLTVNGDVLIGDNKASSLNVRHIDGKEGESNNPGTLHLNYKNKQQVHIGSGDFNSRLQVYGNVAIGRNIDVTDIAQTLFVDGNAKINDLQISNNDPYLISTGEDKILRIRPLSSVFSISNQLESTGNTLTSTVNGIRATANAVNSVQTSLSGNQLTTSVNGVFSSVTLSGLNTNNWSLTGNLGTDPNINFLGTKDNNRLVLKTNDIEKMTILPGGNVGIGTSTPSKLLTVNGDVLIGDNKASSLNVRHIDGKDYQSNNPGTLHLNYNNQKQVHIGSGDFNSRLQVYGNIAIGRNIDVTDIAQTLFVDGNVKINDLQISNNDSYLISTGEDKILRRRPLSSLFSISNQLESTGNTLTSTVNGIRATANAVNSVQTTLNGNNLTTSVNGVVSNAVDLASLIPATTNTLALNGQTLTSTVNGVVSNTIDLSSLTPTTTNNISLSGNTMTSNVNGVSSTSATVSNVTNTLSGSQLTTSVNGVASNTVDLSTIVSQNVTQSYYSEWTTNLVEGENIFNIADGTAQVTNWVTGVEAVTKYLLINSIAMNVSESNAEVEVKAISPTQFKIISNVATPTVITAQYPGKINNTPKTIYENATLVLNNTHYDCYSTGDLKIYPHNIYHSPGYVVQLQVTVVGKLMLGYSSDPIDMQIYNTGTHIIDVPFEDDWRLIQKTLYYKLEDINNSDNLPATVNMKILNGNGETFDNQEINDSIKCEPTNITPSVSITWDNNTIADKTCVDTSCSYTINVNASDPDNNIITKNVQISTDSGVTWSSIISNLGNSTSFGDNISSSVRWYKVIVTDAGGLSATSNILKITKTSSAPTKSFWYQGLWDCPDDVHDPDINSWVDYKDEYGVTHRQIIGCRQYGCQEVRASSIVDFEGVGMCSPLTFDNMTTMVSESHNSCVSLYKISCYNPEPYPVSIQIYSQFSGDALYATWSLPAADFQVTSNGTYTIPANTTKTFSFGIDVAAHAGGTSSYIVAELLGGAGGSSGTDYFRNHGGGHCHTDIPLQNKYGFYLINYNKIN